MKETREVVVLKLDDILPNRFQPRIKFDEKAIVELSESIKEHGVIQPIIVRKISDKYEIIAGERRYKASVMAGKTTIPAIVVELDDKDSSEIALIENVQRQDLTPIEEAISYRKILDMGYLTQDELATKLGVAQSTVANKLRLLNLDDDVQDALLDEKISERHARSLLKLNNPSMQKEMLKRIINERLTVRKTDEEIEKMINNVSPFDSIENNMNQNINNETKKQETTFNDNANPFIINNEVNSISNSTPQNNIINEEPVNVVPENIEVLDFNDFMVDNVNPEPENINNFPSMPIVEDDFIQSKSLDNNTEIEEQVSTFEEVKPEFEQITETNIIPSSDEAISENQVTESNDTTEENETPNDDGTELRPGRFFNILNSDVEDEQLSNEETHEEENITNISNEVPETPSMTNIFGQSFGNVSSESSVKENTNLNIDNDEIKTFNYNMPPVTPVYENNISEERQEETNNIMNLRDVINMIRDCADKIEKNNFDIDVEEFDFDDLYQIIFKIKK